MAKRKKTRRAKHKCDQCGRSFATGTAYDRHMSRAHGVMSFRGRNRSRITCGYCSHISHTRAEANRHRKKHGLPALKRARKDKRTSEQKAVSFFMKHSGAVGRKRESARELAHAEAEMERRGWRVDWEHEQEPDLSWMDDEEQSRDHEILVAILRDENGNVLGSLGNNVDVSDSDRRMIEAELASEAL